MRRFELREGETNKFWQVDVEGATLTVTYGKIGSAGQTKLKTCASAVAASAERDKLVREKTGKGYVEIAAGSTGTKKTGTKKAAEATASTGASTSASGPIAKLIAKLDSIESLDEDGMATFEAITEKLESAPKKDRALLDAILGFLERCGDDDDFGLFSTAECWIDEFPGAMRTSGLLASVGRRPMWKTLELVGNSEEATTVLRALLDRPGVDEHVADQVRRHLGIEAPEAPSEASAAPEAPSATSKEDEEAAAQREFDDHVRKTGYLSLSEDEFKPEVVAGYLERFPEVTEIHLAWKGLTVPVVQALCGFSHARFYVDDMWAHDDPPRGFGLSDKVVAAFGDRLSGLKFVGDSKQLGRVLELTYLRRLDLEGATLKEDDIARLAVLERLVELTLPSSSVDVVLGTRLAALHGLHLTSLSIQSESRDPTPAAVLEGIVGFPKLEKLALGFTAPDDKGFARLAALSELREVTSFAKTSERCFATVANWKKLRKLYWYPGLSDASIKALAGLPIEELRIAGKKLTDGCVSTLASLTSLRTLDLSEASITGAGYRQLFEALPALAEVKVESKAASGEMLGASRLPVALEINKGVITAEHVAALKAPGLRAGFSLTLLHCKLSDEAIEALIQAKKTTGCKVRVWGSTTAKQAKRAAAAGID